MTLVVMAAGRGSRFGGMKQVAGIGPAGESLFDYAVYDAVRAGFDDAVFVVSGEQDFLLHVGVKDTDALYAFVIDRLTERAEVADVNTSVVYEHIRRAVLEPLDDRRRG